MKLFHFFTLLMLSILAAGCFSTSYLSTLPPVIPQFEAKYGSRINEGSTLIEAKYFYTSERTKHGEYVTKVYNPDLNLLTQYMTYKEGFRVLHGETKEWYDNGNLWFEGNYTDGKKDGEWKYYDFEHGYMDQFGAFANNEKEGEWQGLDSLGKQRFIYNFRQGKKHGECLTFKDGEPIIKEVFEFGILIDEEIMDEAALPGEHVQPFFSSCASENKSEQKKCTEKELLTYMYTNLRYPTIARENGLEGKAFFSFVINKDGILEQIKTKRGLSTEINNECIRLIKSLPSWDPGTHNGKKVKVQYVLPVRFKLQG